MLIATRYGRCTGRWVEANTFFPRPALSASAVVEIGYNPVSARPMLLAHGNQFPLADRRARPSG